MNPTFQNAVMNVVMSYFTRILSNKIQVLSEVINTICDGTMARSPARRPLVLVYCWYGKSDWVPGKKEQNISHRLHEEFIVDVVEALMSARKPSSVSAVRKSMEHGLHSC